MTIERVSDRLGSFSFQLPRQLLGDQMVFHGCADPRNQRSRLPSILFRLPENAKTSGIMMCDPFPPPPPFFSDHPGAATRLLD